MTPGYRDNFGVWHDHAQEDFCKFHPMDMFCRGQQQFTVATTEVPKQHDEGMEHGLAHILLDYGIFWWVLGFACLGALGIFRKKIKAWLK